MDAVINKNEACVTTYVHSNYLTCPQPCVFIVGALSIFNLINTFNDPDYTHTQSHSEISLEPV